MRVQEFKFGGDIQQLIKKGVKMKSATWDMTVTYQILEMVCLLEGLFTSQTAKFVVHGRKKGKFL
jgi:phage-related protein